MAGTLRETTPAFLIMSSPHDTPDFGERLRRLEEAQAFAEHAGDQLIDHLRALERRVMETAKRLEALELRLGMLAERVISEGEAPATERRATHDSATPDSDDQ